MRDDLYKEINYKEVAHLLLRQRSPDQGEPTGELQSESKSEGRRRPVSQLRDRQAEGKNSFLAFILFKSSADGMKPTHPGGPSAVFRPADSDVNLI